MVDGRDAPRGPGPASTRRLLAPWAALAGATLVLLGLWQGQSYWEYSDGVYALSARMLLDGHALYGDFAAAQPPPLYLLGAAALAIDDGPAAIRVAMALAQACTSLLVLAAVGRLTGSRPAALAAAVAALLTPWALREHAQLVPEVVAAPLVMAAALAAAADGRRAGVLAGALGACAVALKLAFVLPALAIALAARDRRWAIGGLALAGALLGGACLAAFGEPLWTNVVRAQLQTGRATLGYVAGLWAQAGWNLLPLLALAVLAWRGREQLADRTLARCLAAASAGSLLLLATLAKHGSSLTVVVVVEPPLLCLAAGGVTATVRELRQRRGAGGAAARRAGAPGAGRSARWRSGAPAVVAVAALGLGGVQIAALLLSPSNPRPFIRPLAASGPARTLSSAEVAAAVAGIRRCPAGARYAGPPYLAFVAGREPAGGQPDPFIIRHAAVLASFRRAAERDPAICATAPRGR